MDATSLESPVGKVSFAWHRVLHLDLVPVNGLGEQLDIHALLMGDLKSILIDKHAVMSPRLEFAVSAEVIAKRLRAERLWPPTVI